MFEDAFEKEELQLDRQNLKNFNDNSNKKGYLNILFEIKEFDSIEKFKVEYVRQHAELSKAELLNRFEIFEEYKEFISK